MQIQIHANDFGMSAGLHEHITRQLGYAMNQGRDMISRIVVRLSDVNDTHGGTDKCCAIEVRLKGAAIISINDTQADLYVAIGRAAERAGRTLNRHIALRQRLAMRSETRLEP